MDWDDHLDVSAIELHAQDDNWDDDEEIQRIMEQFDPPPASGPAVIPMDEDSEDTKAMRPTTLESTPKKKIIPATTDLLRDDEGMASPTSSEVDMLSSSMDSVKTPEDLNTPDVFNSSVLSGQLSWEESPSRQSEPTPSPEKTDQEESEDHTWRMVAIGDKQYKIDMKVIEPYKKVLSHGGYYGDGFNAIIVFCGCYLPDKSRRDYHYVMDNLFMYVISTLDLLVVEDYMIVYFHGATPKHKMPRLQWLKRCYDMIDRRLKKNLKGLLVVHPTLWLKTVMLMTRPFISSKFSAKLKYVRLLKDMSKYLPTEYIYVPDEVKAFDDALNRAGSSPLSTPS